MLLSCDAVNPKSSVFLDYQAMKPLAEAYSYLGIRCDKLHSQTVVAKDMFGCEIENSTTETVLQKLTEMKSAFPDLATFARLVLTMPVSSAGAERSFSTMKRVKTCLRSTMADSRLSNLCIISIERSLSSELMTDPTAVVDNFSKVGKRRLCVSK
jgi:hypothetical protein